MGSKLFQECVQGVLGGFMENPVEFKFFRDVFRNPEKFQKLFLGISRSF